ncbi:hypothetical protein C0992_011608, partial [Termitomyces sp. T32_za158]
MAQTDCIPTYPLGYLRKVNLLAFLSSLGQISMKQIRNLIIANFSPPIVSTQELERTADKLIELYPDIPALGSPFNTGNETFGLSSVFKQAAALDGDVAFQAQRRNFNQVAAKAGLKTYGYLFTEPQPDSGPFG